MDEPDPKQTPVPPQAHAFRTYASDLAKLGGKSPATDVKPVPAPMKPVAPAPKPADAHPAAAPVAPPRPYDPPPATIIPKAPTSDESREDILARLKARVAPVVPAPQAPAPPPPAYVYEKAPSTDEKREEVLARLRAKSGAPPAPVAPIRPAPSAPPAPGPGDPAALHTYKSDFSDKTKRENASPITVLAAEQNAVRSVADVPEKDPKSRTLLIVGSVLLILAGGASVFFAYSFVTGRPAIPFTPLVPSLVFGDRHEEISGEGAELRGALARLGADLGEGQVAIAYVTTASTTAKGETIMVPAEGGALIEALGLSAPSIVLRNIENASTVGVIRTRGEARPFFILRVASYERTFAGMLSWEPTMARDLGAFYPEHPDLDTGTSTASSSPRIAEKPSFRDEILLNHDVRALRDSEGRAILIYGYRDKETLVIARDETAFAELLGRLSATRAR